MFRKDKVLKARWGKRFLSLFIVLLILIVGGQKATLQPNSTAVVVVGLMVTSQVPATLIEAFHQSVQNFNTAQTKVKVELLSFVGRGGHPSQASGSSVPRFIIGDFEENMNEGKTRAWFQYAAHTYPRSDWIFKLDTDVAIHWASMSKWLTKTHRDLRYIGALNTYEFCGKYSHCPRPGCKDMTGSCWIYMSGGFYGLSTELASSLSTCPYYKSHSVGIEDLMVGRAIKDCAAGAHVQVIGIPRNVSWCHSKAVNVTHITHGWFPMAGECV